MIALRTDLVLVRERWGGGWKVWWKYMRVEMPGRGGKGRGCNGGGGYWVVYTRSYFQSGRLILYN
jgi:hypothetical protein